uniref:Uncharacterized protein n=1 Tax=Octopus bimaculoides TaxID=37653 RepID=A0A0L8HPU4_OCTBM
MHICTYTLPRCLWFTSQATFMNKMHHARFAFVANHTHRQFEHAHTIQRFTPLLLSLTQTHR